MQIYLFLTRLAVTDPSLYNEICSYFNVVSASEVVKIVKTKLVNRKKDLVAYRKSNEARGRAFIVEIEPTETPVNKVIGTIRNFLFAVAKSQCGNIFRMKGAGSEFKDYTPGNSLTFSAYLGIFNLLLQWLQSSNPTFHTERYKEYIR